MPSMSITVYFSDKDYEQLQQISTKQNITESQWCRRSIQLALDQAIRKRKIIAQEKRKKGGSVK